MTVKFLGYKEGKDEVFLFSQVFYDVPPIPTVGDMIEVHGDGPWKVVGRSFFYDLGEPDSADVLVHIICKEL